MVVELEALPFKPEYAGQLNFYINIVDEKIEGKNENKTIGLLICKGKAEIMSQYALLGYSKSMKMIDNKSIRVMAEELKLALSTIEEVKVLSYNNESLILEIKANCSDGKILFRLYLLLSDNNQIYEIKQADFSNCDFLKVNFLQGECLFANKDGAERKWNPRGMA